jgi:hypothetical protein
MPHPCRMATYQIFLIVLPGTFPFLDNPGQVKFLPVENSPTHFGEDSLAPPLQGRSGDQWVEYGQK